MGTERELQSLADQSSFGMPHSTVPTSARSSLAQATRIQEELCGRLSSGKPDDLVAFGRSPDAFAFCCSLDKYEASDLINCLARGEYEFVRSSILEHGFTI